MSVKKDKIEDENKDKDSNRSKIETVQGGVASDGSEGWRRLARHPWMWKKVIPDCGSLAFPAS